MTTFWRHIFCVRSNCGKYELIFFTFAFAFAFRNKTKQNEF